MKIDLVFLSYNLYGGWVTFTRHLHDSLMTLGHEPRIIRIREKSDDKTHPFGYELPFTARTPEDLLAEKNIRIIVAVQKNESAVAQQLMKEDGTFAVIHDHNEVKHFGDVPTANRVIVIRPANLPLVKDSFYIPHPYVRSGVVVPEKTKHAISIARIDFDKNVNVVLAANRHLTNGMEIDIRGFESNRRYTKFKIQPEFPEYYQDPHNPKGLMRFPRSRNAAVELLAPVKFMVDMSTIKGDGGGSQYTFLEAMDVETCCVLHSGWTNVKGEMTAGVNCLTASNGEELANVLKNTTDEQRHRVTQMALANFLVHEPKSVAYTYENFINAHA